MNVKISVKKLFSMTIRIKNLEEDNASLRSEAKILLDDADAELTRKEETINYLTDENDALTKEVEDLKKLFEDKVNSHLQQLAEINELKEDIKNWEDAARSAADNL